MKRRQTEPLGDVIRRFLRQEGIETPLAQHRAVALWPEIAGPQISRATRGVWLRDSTLYVKISNPALRQDLMMGRTLLARRLNEKVGSQVVGQIVFC
ncbi:MAG: DUF721 domain-containing protein [Prevotellaceae bacterium]|nr:DUF721 domain-containing protein [Prevotellaceae bacterium]